MRQREITQRLLEHRLDTREETLHHMQENHMIELSALKKALKDIYENLITSTVTGATTTTTTTTAVGTTSQSVSGKFQEKEEKVPSRQSKQSTTVGTTSTPSIHRSLEEQSLKAILYRLTGIGSMSSNQITISDKLSYLSKQMTKLTSLAEKSNERIESMEEINLKYELENEKLKEENKILLKSIHDLHEILQTTENTASSTTSNGIGTTSATSSGIISTAGTGTNAVNNKKQQLQLKQQTKVIALKVFHLNDEIKHLKIVTLQQKREISMLQHEKKYLRNILTRLESDLHILEEGKLQLQHHHQLPLIGYNPDGLLGGDGEGETDPLIAEFIKLRDDLFTYPLEEEGDEGEKEKKERSKEGKSQPKKPSPLRAGIGLTVDVSEDERKPQDSYDNEDGHGITKEELLDKMEKTTADMLAAKRDSQSQKRQLENLHNKIQELQEVITDQEECIAYYERMAASEGLPIIRGRVPGEPISEAQRRYCFVVSSLTSFSSSLPRGKDWRMMKEEQEKLQEAASATIGSMRSLLEEKNQEIDRFVASSPLLLLLLMTPIGFSQRLIPFLKEEMFMSLEIFVSL